MAIFKPYKITSSQLEGLAKSEGQFIVTTDTHKIYLDEDTATRIELCPSPTKTSDLINDSNFMSGMYIAKYGITTYEQILDAYSKNHIVYCRASSSSNPASGSQTRMAFLAYVQAETNPTEFEFQYYRSVSTHSDSTQGDEVYIYKINKNSGWSVTKRNAYTKVVAGTGMSSNYSNGTITLNATNNGTVTQVTAGTGLTTGQTSADITSTGTLSLDTSGVTAGTYQGLTIDSYGRVTAASDQGYTTNAGTVTNVSTGVGLTGGDITTTGTIKANLKSETKSTLASESMGSTANRQYAVGIDKDDKLSVNIPWTDNNTTYTFDTGDNNGQIKVTPSGGSAQNITVKNLNNAAYKDVDSSISAASTSTKLPTSQAVASFVEGKGYTTNTGTVTQVSAGTGLTGGDITTSGTIALDESGVTAGTYQGLTVDKYGRVTAASDQGYTSNTGTITGITMNGTSKGTSGVVDLGTVLTSYTETDPIYSASAASGITSSDITNWNNKTSNTGTITGVSVNSTSVATSGIANITSIPASILTGAIPSAVTATTQSQGDNSTKIATTAYVDTAIDNLPDPMVFKGSLGTGGTITALPVDGSANIGDTYKVITAGTYASKAADVGDTFICLTKTSSVNTWELIPSGDEPSGTVTSITIDATSPISIDSNSAITTSGSRTISHANSGVTAGTYKSVTVNATGHVTAGTNPTTLNGYGITDAKIDSGVITLGSNTITPLTSGSTLDATKLSGTIPSECYTDNDTKNTTGTTNTTDKIYLAGGKSQGDNPQTYSNVNCYASGGKLYSNAKEAVNLSDSQALTNKTYDGLTLTKATTGFTIAGGTTSKTLTVNDNYTLAAASAKAVDTSISAASTSANLPTSAAVATFVEGKGYTTNTGTVTGVTAGTGLNTTSDNTATDGGTISSSGTLYLTKSGVSAGTYQGITVDKYGRVTSASNQGYVTTDTKNTAGSTDTSSKIYLVGATSQAANPQTYSQDTAYVGTNGHLYSNSKQVVNLSDTQSLTNKTYDGLTLTSESTGFKIKGGTIIKTLTVGNNYTLAGACEKAVDDSISAASTSTNLPTSQAVASFVEGKGYITSYTETDPIFTASAAYGITSANITNWNGKQNQVLSGTTDPASYLGENGDIYIKYSAS